MPPDSQTILSKMNNCIMIMIQISRYITVA